MQPSHKINTEKNATSCPARLTLVRIFMSQLKCEHALRRRQGLTGSFPLVPVSKFRSNILYRVRFLHVLDFAVAVTGQVHNNNIAEQCTNPKPANELSQE